MRPATAAAAAVVVVVAAAASDADADAVGDVGAVDFDFDVDVGFGVGESGAADTGLVQIRDQDHARIHSCPVPCGPHILHDRCAHCKNHGGAAKGTVLDLFHDSVPIRALAESAPRAATPQHVLSHPHVRNHIQSP